jgi:hypothetical protein
MTPLRSSRAFAAALTVGLAALVAVSATPASAPSAHADGRSGSGQAGEGLSRSGPTGNGQSAGGMTRAAVTSGAIGVSVVPAEQGVVRAGADLTLTIGVTNGTGASLPAGVATVYLGATATARADLAAWLDPGRQPDAGDDSEGSGDSAQEGAAPDDARVGRAVLTVTTPALVAGQSVVLDGTSVPAAALGVTEPVVLGARELAVVVTAGTEAEGSARTAVTVAPVSGSPLTALTLATPLDVPASGEGLLTAEALEAATGPSGALGRQLDQTAGRPITVGVDPRVIASIRALGESAPASAALWLQRLDAMPNETFPLAYADADLAALSQSGVGVLAPTSVDLDPALFPTDVEPSVTPEPSASAGPDAGDTGDAGDPDDTGEATTTVPTLDDLLAWDYSLGGLAWPADGSVVGADLKAFGAAGLDTTVVSSTNAGTSAVTGVTATADGHRILVSDDAVSSAFRAAVHAPSLSAWQTAMSELGASLAAVAAEGGGTASVLATLDRRPPTGGYRLADTLAGLQSMPWVSTSTLGSARAAEPRETTLVDSPVTDDRLGQFTSLLATEAATTQFASVLESPSSITGERRLSLLATSSLAWTDQPEAWGVAVDAYRAGSSEILTSVQIVQSSDLLLPSQNGDLPISVVNQLPFPVTVTVSVRPQTPILNVLDSAVEVTVEAQSQTRAPVPVQSVANGDVTIAVSLTSPTGVPISQPVFTTISVQAQWETAAVTVLASLIVVVFAIGILRTVRRRLAARRARSEGPLDTTTAQTTTVETTTAQTTNPDSPTPEAIS